MTGTWKTCGARGLFHSITRTIAALAMTLAYIDASAVTCTTISNGAWNQAARWSCGRAPVAGDTLIIQAGHIITVTGNHVYNGAPIFLIIHGTLQFSGTGSKLTFSCGSFVLVQAGGAVLPDPNASGNSETIRICNTTYWSTNNGATYGPVAWPYDVLPVELIAFTGSSSGDGVDLHWSTASESGSQRFLVQRSTDLLDRTTVSAQAAMGHSMTVTHYQATDRPAHGGVLYYHLVEEDEDGTPHDLRVVAVDHTSDPTMRCWPNPIARGQELTIQHAAVKGAAQLEWWSDEGRMRPLDITPGPGYSQLAPSQMPIVPGIQWIVLRHGGKPIGQCRLVVEDR